MRIPVSGLTLDMKIVWQVGELTANRLRGYAVLVILCASGGELVWRKRRRVGRRLDERTSRCSGSYSNGAIVNCARMQVKSCKTEGCDRFE